jgi:hypothetical protein
LFTEMPSEKYHKTIDEMIEADPAGATQLIFDELLTILEEPALPDSHPGAAAQREAKRTALAAIDKYRARLSEASALRIRRLREIIDMPALPLDHPRAAETEEIRRAARITLMHWATHYGPGGHLEGLGPMPEDE